MKILVIAGDYWHPMEVVRRGIEGMRLDPQRYQFDYIEDAKDIVTKEFLAQHALVIFAKANVIGGWNTSPMFEEGNMALSVADYRAYVEVGGGLLSLHAGNTVDRPEWHGFVGNHFITHPPRCEVRMEPVGGHPIAAGVEPFAQIDEHYQIAGIPEDVDVFLRSASAAGGTQIAGYTRLIGAGRVCALTPGHTMNVWADEMFARLFRNAVDWCAGTVD